MTTKPKARKFRIKRSPTAQEAVPDAFQQPQEVEETAAPLKPDPSAQVLKDKANSGDATDLGSTDIEAIKHEGLTGRQLRMARRIAQKQGLAPTSDFDAVRLLRKEGIDPFKRANMLELVVPTAENAGKEATDAPEKSRTNVQLPQTVPVAKKEVEPVTELSPAERRAREISKIQADISRKRRRRLGLLLARLSFFVMLPTLIAGYYFYAIATPMYGTDSQFLIIQSEGGGGASPFGGILPTQFANSADSIATQAYLQSKDAMLRLDEDNGFRAHFASPTIDPIQRLETDATIEQAYKVYQKNVKIGYDPTEGVIRMEVVAADPAISASFSERLIKYAEERVNDLSRQKREDGMRDALVGFEKAQQGRRDAQEDLIRLQIENGVDPEAEIAALRNQISSYETLLIEKELELAALLDNARPNQARLDGVEGDIRRIRDQLGKLNERMTSATVGENSLAERAVTLQLAQADLAAADVVLQSAQTAMEQARAEANRQVRYLTVAVEPVAPQEPSYPRAFENTLMTFLIFAGVYLMLSLTASILREQVTS
ncbi:MAG: capsule biosynthesis protein [Pseudomonadota bacterium]